MGKGAGIARARSSVKLSDRPRLFLGGEKRMEVRGTEDSTCSSKFKGAGGTDLDRFSGGGGEEKGRGGGEGWLSASESMEMFEVGEPNMDPRLCGTIEAIAKGVAVVQRDPLVVEEVDDGEKRGRSLSSGSGSKIDLFLRPAPVELWRICGGERYSEKWRVWRSMTGPIVSTEMHLLRLLRREGIGREGMLALMHRELE